MGAACSTMGQTFVMKSLISAALLCETFFLDNIADNLEAFKQILSMY